VTTAVTFPTFPPRARRGAWARSWWGKAWIKALEETSVDSGRLARGRTYARAGYVGSITVAPGRILAPVYGSDPTPYRAQIIVEQLSDSDWDRFLDEVAARAGYLAALLDREMPRDLVAAAEDVGVPLLPTVGDLEPDCTCPDWGYPCKHAAALAYQVAWLLDEDPFLLLLLRGRGEAKLMEELRHRDTPAVETSSVATTAGTPATEAYATAPAPLPPPPPPVSTPPALLSVPATDGVDPEALATLVHDAAARASALLRHSGLITGDNPATTPNDLVTAVTTLDVRQDAARLAATHPGMPSEARERLAQASARSLTELDQAACAWRYGGLGGLQVLETPWTPPTLELARARAAFVAIWDGDEAPQPRVWRNRCTLPPGPGRTRWLQVRYGQDGCWYPYLSHSGAGDDWWPAGPPRPDPAAAVAELLDS